jgi:hypothetical protein
MAWHGLFDWPHVHVELCFIKYINLNIYKPEYIYINLNIYIYWNRYLAAPKPMPSLSPYLINVMFYGGRT